MDTGLIEKNGWLIYWHDKIIWVESEINSDVDDADFFKDPRLFANGVNLIGSDDAAMYKLIARKYGISYFRNDSVVIETNPEFLDTIKLLPMRVKYKTGYPAASETMFLSFIRDWREISIKYKGLADYEIQEVALLRKNDKVRFNELRKP